jgi:hypothetical protein
LSATFSDRCHIAFLAFRLSVFLLFCHIAVLALCFSVKSPFCRSAVLSFCFSVKSPFWHAGFLVRLLAVSAALTLAAQTRSGCSALPRFAQARSGLLNAAQVIAGCSQRSPRSR